METKKYTHLFLHATDPTAFRQALQAWGGAAMEANPDPTAKIWAALKANPTGSAEEITRQAGLSFPGSSAAVEDGANRKKGGRKPNAATQAVHAYASTVGQFTRAACSRDLGLTRVAVEAAIDTLVRGKRLKRVGRATYEWIVEKRSGRDAPLEDRIWHALRINSVWSCSDIAIQAGTTVSYMRKRLRDYRAEKLVARHGRRGLHCLWRLTAKGREQLTRPAVEIFEADPLVLLACKIMKLVSTGMAMRFEDANMAALVACDELRRKLEGLCE